MRGPASSTSHENVLLIVDLVAKLEMVRVAAWPVVTVVKHKDTSWNRPEEKRGCCSVHAQSRKHAVAMLITGARPFPASARTKRRSKFPDHIGQMLRHVRGIERPANQFIGSTISFEPAAATRFKSKSLGQRPTLAQPCLQSFVFDAPHRSPLRDGQTLPVEFQEAVAAFVVLLLSFGRPPAVVRPVASVIVPPIKAVLQGRPRANVSNERRKVKPSGVHVDPTVGVILPMPFAGAAGDHLLPDGVVVASAETMGSIDSLFVPAAAGRSARKQRHSFGRRFRAAIAPAVPFRVSLPCRGHIVSGPRCHHELAEAKPSEVAQNLPLRYGFVSHGGCPQQLVWRAGGGGWRYLRQRTFLAMEAING